MTNIIKNIIEETISYHGWSCTRDFNNKRLYRFQIKMTDSLLSNYHQNIFNVTIYKPNKTIVDDFKKKYSVKIMSTLQMWFYLDIKFNFLKYNSYKQIIKKIIILISENYEQIKQFYLNIDKLIKTNRVKKSCMIYFSNIIQDFFNEYVNDRLCKTTLSQCLNKKVESNQFNKYILYWFDNNHYNCDSFYRREYMRSFSIEDEQLLEKIIYYDIVYVYKKNLFI